MKFEKTSCSQCGQEFGPGDHGFSHCSDHLKNPVRYTALTNGTAFMGMGSNTGLNEGHEYPYVLWTDYEALQFALAQEKEHRQADSLYWESVATPGCLSISGVYDKGLTGRDRRAKADNQRT
jgi:hypothetical protein